MGACSRCRILRKTCDKGSPCSACEKVISPRVWNAGCIRDKLSDHVQLYSAGVQIVVSQKRCQELRDQLNPTNKGAVVEISQFPELGSGIVAPILEYSVGPVPGPAGTSRQIVMIDVDKDDLPQKLEEYMREVLTMLVQHERSTFARVLLETAIQERAKTDDKLLELALELWGLVEIIDRENEWQISEKPQVADGQSDRVMPPQSPTLPDPPLNVYSVMTQQLSAAAERKASTTSKVLLDKMNRDLHDSKTKVGFPMFLSALILLNCIEKTAWTFLAWETDSIRPNWPLEKDPASFTRDLSRVAENLKTLLVMRKVLPQTEKSEPHGTIAAVDAPEAMHFFFHRLGLDCKYPRFPAPLFSCADIDHSQGIPSKLGRISCYFPRLTLAPRSCITVHISSSRRLRFRAKDPERPES